MSGVIDGVIDGYFRRLFKIAVSENAYKQDVSRLFKTI